MNNKTSLKQILSAGLSLAMVVASSPMPASAFGPVEATGPAFVAKFTPAEQLGYVASSYSPDANATRPRLIIISDLHGHVEVQHHIMGILEGLVSKIRSDASVAQKTPIFVEGGWEKDLEEPLRTMSNSAVRSFMSEYYLQKAELNASQAYSEKVAGSNQVTLIGVENKAEYLGNKAVYAKTYPARKELLLAIEREESAIKVLDEHVTGRTFRNIQKMRDDYNAGRLSPESYARSLVRLARRNGIANQQVAVLQNASTATNSDLDVALSEVYRTVTKSLVSQKPLSSFLRKSLENEDIVRANLIRIDSSLDLLKRLVGNQLTPSEVPLALNRMPQLLEVTRLLLAESPLKDKAEQIVKESFDFYPFAKARDLTLAENSLKNMESFGPDATGILVAGGFHTDAIADYLRSKGVSYLLIHPQISRDLTAVEQLNYVERVCDEHVTPEEIKADIESLKSGRMARLATAAIGPITGLGEEETQGGERKLMQVADQAGVAALLSAREAALTAVLAGTEAVAIAPAEAINENQAARQMRDVLGDQFNDIKDDIDWDSSLTINRTLGGISGGTTPGVGGLGRLINDIVGATDSSANAEDISAVHFVALKNGAGLEKLGEEGEALWNEKAKDDTKNVRTVLVDVRTLNLLRNTIDKLNKLDPKSPEAAAVYQSLHTLVHELVHVFDKEGKDETSTRLKAVAIAAVIAGENGGVAGVTEFLKAVAAQLALTTEGQSLGIKLGAEGMAESIAALFDPTALRSVNVQKLAARIKELHPEDSDFAVEKVIHDEVTSVSGRVRLYMAADPDKKAADDVNAALTEIDSKATGERTAS